MDLLDIATAFRAAADILNQQEDKPALMSDFPEGCCGSFSVILAAHLCSQGWPEPQLVFATQRGRPDESHAWLELNGLIIDITADQFPGRPSVFAGPADVWYRKVWEVENRRHPSDSRLEPLERRLLARICAIMERREQSK